MYRPGPPHYAGVVEIRALRGPGCLMVRGGVTLHLTWKRQQESYSSLYRRPQGRKAKVFSQRRPLAECGGFSQFDLPTKDIIYCN